MREFLINAIDKTVLGLVKIRYKIVRPTLTLPSEFLQHWKEMYPKSFTQTRGVVPPLNPVAAALVDVSPLPVPEPDFADVHQFERGLDSPFPFGGKSNDLVEGPENPTRIGTNFNAKI